MESDEATDHLQSVNVQLSTCDYLAEMWNRRDFAVAVPLEELRAQHKTTLLGNLWHLGNPLLSIGVYYFIFGVLLHTNRGIDHFLVWLTIGVFGFRLTSSSVLGGATSISNNKGLIRAIRFPRALLPVSVVSSGVMTFAIELALISALCLVSGVGLSSRLLLLPLIVLVHSALNLGGAFIAARLNEAYRDVQQIIPFMFRLLFYMSGVIFPIQKYLGDNVSGAGKLVIWLNPMLHILDLYRWVFLGTPVSRASVIAATLASLGLLVFGFRYFRAAEWRYGRS